MSEARQVQMNADPIQLLMNELKAHISQELKGIKVVDELLTVEEAAKYMKISRETLYQRLRKKSLPASLIHRVDGSVYFLPSEIHAFIKSS